jgi:flagellar motor protein MotB
MAKRSTRKPKLDPPWLAYTDLLSSTLLVLSVVVVASVLAKLTNEKPPVIRLSDAKDYRFERGSFKVSKDFRDKLISEELPKIDKAIQCYAIDTVEIIGHTDKSPNTGMSNMDKYPSLNKLSSGFKKVYAGSNTDLGLLRAVSVQTLLQEKIGDKHQGLQFRAYSASSLIDPDSKQGSNLDREKRRIEIRLTRRSEESTINRC